MKSCILNGKRFGLLSAFSPSKRGGLAVICRVLSALIPDPVLRARLAQIDAEHYQTLFLGRGSSRDSLLNHDRHVMAPFFNAPAALCPTVVPCAQLLSCG